jgi:transcriptional regulator with XRE-family HTH domain
MSEQQFGDRLRELRLARGWTQKQLASRSGLSHTQVSHLETGFSNPSAQSALRLAEALDTPVGRLLGEKAPLGEGGLDYGEDEVAWIETYRRIVEYRHEAAQNELDRLKLKLAHSYSEEALVELAGFIIEKQDFYTCRMEAARVDWGSSHPERDYTKAEQEALKRLWATFENFTNVIREAQNEYKNLPPTAYKKVAYLQERFEGIA